MKITEEILSKAKDKARNHIKLVNQDGYDKSCDPYDHWEQIGNYDLNVVCDPPEENTWKCTLYSGANDSKGYSVTNHEDYIRFYTVKGEEISA